MSDLLRRILHSDLFFTFVWLPFLGLFGGILIGRIKMDKELLNKELGKELSLKIELKGGKVLLELSHEGALGGLSFGGNLGVDQLITALEAAIPGGIDNAVLEVLRAALKKAD